MRAPKLSWQRFLGHPSQGTRHAQSPPGRQGKGLLHYEFRGYTPMSEETLDAPNQTEGDTKEGLYFGREVPADSEDAHLPLHGPNQWPPRVSFVCLTVCCLFCSFTHAWPNASHYTVDRLPESQRTLLLTFCGLQFFVCSMRLDRTLVSIVFLEPAVRILPLKP